MTAEKYIRIASITLLASVMFEITLLVGLAPVSDRIYHYLHIFLMLVLIISQIMLYKSLKKNNLTAKYALWLALGMGLTAIGDYVNGANSCIEPVSHKLSWALLLFGSGYVIYNYILWNHTNKIISKKSTPFSKYKYFVAIPIIVINLISWLLHVEPNLRNLNLLYYGSFFFNLTIYVVMPLFAVWYCYSTDWSIRGLIILMGAILIPYSDLILFASWLKNGNDPAVPVIQLYAYNWILYFGGQALMSMLPSFIVMDETKN